MKSWSMRKIIVTNFVMGGKFAASFDQLYFICSDGKQTRRLTLEELLPFCAAGLVEFAHKKITYLYQNIAGVPLRVIDNHVLAINDSAMPLNTYQRYTEKDEWYCNKEKVKTYITSLRNMAAIGGGKCPNLWVLSKDSFGLKYADKSFILYIGDEPCIRDNIRAWLDKICEENGPITLRVFGGAGLLGMRRIFAMRAFTKLDLSNFTPSEEADLNTEGMFEDTIVLDVLDLYKVGTTKCGVGTRTANRMDMFRNTVAKGFVVSDMGLAKRLLSLGIFNVRVME